MTARTPSSDVHELGADGRPVHRSTLESLLLERRLVSAVRLAAVAGRVVGAKRPLVEVLLEQGVLDEAAFVRAVASASRMEPLPAEEVRPDPKVQALVPAELALRHGILPLRVDPDETLVVATADPFQIDVLDEVRARAGRRVRVVLAPPTAVREGLHAARVGEETFDELLRNAPAAAPAIEIGVAPAPEELDDAGAALGVDVRSEESPVVRFVNLLLADAIRQGASDVHVEPERERTRIRFRVDGTLHEIRSLPPSVRAALTSRVKIVSGLDILETRRPQDGRATVRVDGRSYDLRVSTLPSFFGEKVVLRILDASAPTFALDASGIRADDLAAWRELTRRPSGMLLLTGPTGSGKTSTLYASLLELRDPATNVVAIEDPVEFQFPGIVHVPVRPVVGTTFATALRSVLRQDPDVVLLGEVRDRETAEVAVQAALTGHLLLSTLHTNDALGALHRLGNLGVERDLLASALLGVMAQRLVRTVCDACAAPDPGADDLLALLGAPPDADRSRLRRGRGCARCRGTGLRGRTAIVELVRMTPELRRLVADGAAEADLRAAVARAGTVPLARAGLEKVLAGVSTPEEVLAVTGPGEPAAPVAAPRAPRAAPARPCRACGLGLDAGWAHCPRCGRAATTASRGSAVVVIEDDPVQRRVVAATLRGRFDRVLEAGDGGDGIDLVAREKPDLVVVDQGLPGLSGVDVIRVLRGQLETASLPVVMLTAADPADLEATALEAGADDYLTKPVTADRLLARVNALLATHRRIEGALAARG